MRLSRGKCASRSELVVLLLLLLPKFPPRFVPDGPSCECMMVSHFATYYTSANAVLAFWVLLVLLLLWESGWIPSGPLLTLPQDLV